MKVNIDTEVICNEVIKELLPDFKSKIKNNISSYFKNKLEILFMNSRTIQRIKQTPYLARNFGTSIEDKDLGLGDKLINDLITEKILEDDFKKYMNDYMEKNFSKYLDEAMDKAMQHKANKMAFHLINKD